MHHNLQNLSLLSGASVEGCIQAQFDVPGFTPFWMMLMSFRAVTLSCLMLQSFLMHHSISSFDASALFDVQCFMLLWMMLASTKYRKHCFFQRPIMNIMKLKRIQNQDPYHGPYPYHGRSEATVLHKAKIFRFSVDGTTINLCLTISTGQDLGHKDLFISPL